MKKSERHRAKRDELVTVFERISAYTETHLREVALVAAGVVIAVLSGLGVSSWVEGRNERSSFLLGELIQAYRAPLALSPEAQQAPAGVVTYASAGERDDKVIEIADDILARYGGSKAAPKALYYKALALTGERRYEDAAKTLDEFLRRYPGDFLAPLARFALARVKEAQGNPAEALIQFQALADDSGGAFPREEGLLGMARCQEAMGKKEEALKIYRRILSDFPNSAYDAEARSKVDQLS